MKKKLTASAIFLLVFFTSLLLLSGNPQTNQLGNNQEKKETTNVISYEDKETQESSLPSQKENSTSTGVLVTRVIDGDTIEIEGGQRIRYIGIDTPETSDPRTGVQCYGKEATSKNRALVEGKKVRLEKDVSETDKYGRLLRYVFIGDQLINEVLVKEGYAFSSPYPPDIKYQSKFDSAEKYARENDEGLWGSCGFVAGEKTTLPSSDCNIKGNISSSGEKIYHVPGQKYYNQTVISESKGERWFCSEEEAKEAGWRKSKL